MAAVFITHKVEDFNRWLEAFEAHAPHRAEMGAHKSIVWQHEDDPNMVSAIIKTNDMAKAHEFVCSENLKQAMEAAGVVSQPVIHFLTNPRKYEN